jgi:hypothetical protein
MFLAIGFGATLFGRRFRLYSIVTIVVPGARSVSLESAGHVMLGQTKIRRDEPADVFAERKDRRADPVAS